MFVPVYYSHTYFIILFALGLNTFSNEGKNDITKRADYWLREK